MSRARPRPRRPICARSWPQPGNAPCCTAGRSRAGSLTACAPSWPCCRWSAAMPRRPRWPRSVPLRTAALIAAVVVSAALFSTRPLVVANAVGNSPVLTPLYCVPFLIAYALGYEAGVIAGLAAVAALIAGLQVVNGSFSPLELMLTICPWIAGQVVRSRRRLADQLRARNEELLAQQEVYASEAVRYERSRIAAELHDIVGHALSLMVVQASAGQRAALPRGGNADGIARGDGNARGDGIARGGGAAARMALESVAEAAREAQAEVGLLAGMLSGDQTQTRPSTDQGLDLVAELVRQVQAAGVEVTCRLTSDGEDADATSAEVASRIVTEALTNAVKHAPGAPA